MNPIKIAVLICIVMLVSGCSEKTNGKTAEKQAIAAPAEVSVKNDATVGSDGKETNVIAVITSVHAQWIISDSMPKAEITLIGENLASNATVTSNSPHMTVEKIEPDPFRTLVIVAMNMATPPGSYDLQYQAPGQSPIPFTIQYAGLK